MVDSDDVDPELLASFKELIQVLLLLPDVQILALRDCVHVNRLLFDRVEEIQSDVSIRKGIEEVILVVKVDRDSTLQFIYSL